MSFDDDMSTALRWEGIDGMSSAETMMWPSVVVVSGNWRRNSAHGHGDVFMRFCCDSRCCQLCNIFCSVWCLENIGVAGGRWNGVRFSLLAMMSCLMNFPSSVAKVGWAKLPMTNGLFFGGSSR